MEKKELKELKEILNDFLEFINFINELSKQLDVDCEFDIDGINLCKFLKIAVNRLKQEYDIPF